MAFIKDYQPKHDPSFSQPLKPFGFSESKTAFATVHKYLISKGIVDASSDSLVEDLLDGTKTDEVIVNTIIDKLSGLKTSHSLNEKLVYIALGGFYKLEIMMRIRRGLAKHKKDCQKALAENDFEFAKTLIKGDTSAITEEECIKALNSRIKAISKVGNLHGEHFLKRVYHVSDGWKINLQDLQ